MECLTICKIERKAKRYNCLVLGKTWYFLFFFFQFLLKGNGIITSSGRKQHGTLSLSFQLPKSPLLLWYALPPLLMAVISRISQARTFLELCLHPLLPFPPSPCTFSQPSCAAASPSILLLQFLSPVLPFRILAPPLVFSPLRCTTQPADTQEENIRTLTHMRFLSLKIRKEALLAHI